MCSGGRYGESEDAHIAKLNIWLIVSILHSLQPCRLLNVKPRPALQTSK